MKNLKMIVKLLGGFSIVALIVLVLGIIGLTGARSLDGYIDEIGTVRLPSIESLLIISEAQTAIDSAENALLAGLLTGEIRTAQFQRFADAKKRAEDARAIYEPLPQTEEEALIWKDFVTAWDAWMKDHDTFVNLANSYFADPTDEKYKAMSDQALVVNGISFSRAESLLNRIIEINKAVSSDSVLAAGSMGAQVELISLIGMILGVVLSFLIGIIITLGITRPLEIGVRFAKEIARGNLNAMLEYFSRDEIGQLAEALREMKNKLADVVGAVLSGSEQIAAASEQLAQGNQDLSNRTEQQATALEETSAAIEEMNSSIKSNADNTKTADSLSREAVEKAGEGETTISRMINSMDEINLSSNRIADIIEVITNIAFQTNLLALNASIEAARAGEQGKGFAVVAVEVRKLAKRSDKAANEITEIIRNSNVKVTEGVEIANEAGAMLKDINEAIKKVTVLVSEISAASQEQLTSAEQINQTLSSLDENTQRNAALVEEAASSTEELSSQAQELNSTINYFKIERKATERKQLPPSTTVKKTQVTALKPAKNVVPGSDYETFVSHIDEGNFDEF